MSIKRKSVPAQEFVLLLLVVVVFFQNHGQHWLRSLERRPYIHTSKGYCIVKCVNCNQEEKAL